MTLNFIPKRFIREFADFFLPRYCCMCDRRLSSAEQHICTPCLRTLNRIEYEGGEVHGVIERLFWGKVPVEKATSMFKYEGENTRKILHNIKYFDRPQVAAFLAALFVKENRDSDFFDGIQAIVPVPLAKQKKRKRGYNQSEFIAHGLSQETGIPVINDAVIRRVNNPTQTKLSHQERKDNVKDIFKLAEPKQLEGKHILVVDDVITTGATILSLAEEINKAQNVKLSFFSLAFAGQIIKAGLPGNPPPATPIPL